MYNPPCPRTKKKKKTFNLLKRVLTTSGATILFCLLPMQCSVSDSESAPNTVTKHHEALFGNIPLHSKVLQSALQRSPYVTHPRFYSGSLLVLNRRLFFECLLRQKASCCIHAKSFSIQTDQEHHNLCTVFTLSNRQTGVSEQCRPRSDNAECDI